MSKDKFRYNQKTINYIYSIKGYKLKEKIRKEQKREG